MKKLFNKIKSWLNHDQPNEETPRHISQQTNDSQKFVDMMQGDYVKKIIFKVKTDKVLSIQELTANKLFECYQVKPKTSESQDDYKLSDIQLALFGVKQNSTFGFEVSYHTEKQEYIIKIISLATTSDWMGALTFIQMISLLTDSSISDDKNIVYTADTIIDYKYSEIFLKAVQHLITKINETNNICVFSGVKYPIHIGKVMIHTLFKQGEIFDNYDKRLKLTQHMNARYSKQELLRSKHSQNNLLVCANFFELNTLNVLPYEPMLSPEHLAYIRPEQVEKCIVFVFEGKNNIAEIPHSILISVLPEEKWFFIDEVTIVVEPVQWDEIFNKLK